METGIAFQKLWKTRTAKPILLMVVLFFVVVVVAIQILVLPLEILPMVWSKSSFISNNLVNATESPTDDDSKDSNDYQEETGKEFKFDIGNMTALNKKKGGPIRVEKTKDGLPLTNNSTDSSFTSVVIELKDDMTQAEGNLKVSNPTPTTSSPIAKKQNADNKNIKKVKKKRHVYKEMTYPEMERALQMNRAFPDSTKPLWSTEVDQQLLDAKAEIENAPFVTEHEGLHPSVFRNFSAFVRSYELMEKMLKVYIYKEGDQPIFHKPFFTGIYSSEGWFMKQMEDNKQFVTDDTSKAHLFYLPFSSWILRQEFYVRNSHSQKNVIAHLRSYVSTIASKYPFWNRTDGADHFLAACHDWGTQETSKSMNSSIRALCVADVDMGFRIGKDVSLPETNVHNAKGPLEHIGGKPAHLRTLLAYFAGKMHGYLRPILLQHWQNKHPNMLISGPIPHSLTTKVNITTSVDDNRKRNQRKRRNKYGFMTTYPYMNHMKDSKYCICPRGSDVNSPRVVEAIFYGCVPVIMSYNFVPPLFEVFEWSRFSVILPENDIGRLRDILLGIPESKYFELERGVREVRKHFLWNKKAKKYDLFHMILYNVWINRIYNVKKN